eukprot:1928314-Prymnesium_polylepis.1
MAAPINTRGPCEPLAAGCSGGGGRTTGSPVYDRLLEAKRRIRGWWMPRTPPGWETAGARLRGD